jgi:hypothetical protein
MIITLASTCQDRQVELTEALGVGGHRNGEGSAFRAGNGKNHSVTKSAKDIARSLQKTGLLLR